MTRCSCLATLLVLATVVINMLAFPRAAGATTSGVCYRVVNVTRGDVLNLRSGPSADNSIVGVLVPGRNGVISRIGRCIPRSVSLPNRWCPITHFSGNGKATGWAKARYLRQSECP